MGILDSLESGLKSVLPYALPAALGAGLGGPLGGLAGVAAAQPDPDEQLKRQKAQLDIQAEQMQIQGQQAEQQWQKEFYSNPEFQGFIGKALGIDPKSMPSFVGMPPKDLIGMITAVQKMRSQKTPYGPASYDQDKKQWIHQNLQSGEWEKTYEPASAYTTGLHLAETDKSIAAANVREADAQAQANAREAANISDRDKLALIPHPRLLTLWNEKDPSKTKLVSAGEGYEPPAGWTTNRPRSAPAPKQWTALDALNAKSKARADVIKRLTVPGTLWGSTPPPPDVVDRETITELATLGLDKDGKKLPTGYSVTFH